MICVTLTLSSLTVGERVALVAGQARADRAAVGLAALSVAAAGVRVAGVGGGHTCSTAARQYTCIYIPSGLISLGPFSSPCDVTRTTETGSTLIHRGGGRAPSRR